MSALKAGTMRVFLELITQALNGLLAEYDTRNSSVERDRDTS